MSDTDTTTDATTDTTTTTADTPKAPEGYLSPEQVNKVVQDRLARDRRERPSDEEIAEWQQAANKLQEIEQANATELEKAQKAAAEHQARVTDLEAELQESRVNSAVLTAASLKGIVDGDAAAKLLDWSQIEYDKGGKPINIDDLLDSLVEAKPFLGGQPPTPPGDGGARGEPVQTKDLDEQIVEARKKGDHMLEMRLNNLKLLQKRREEQAAA